MKSYVTRMNTAFPAMGGGQFVNNIRLESVAFVKMGTGVVNFDDSFFYALIYVELFFLLYKFLALG